jgi:enoyl-CoA hydratase/carnithine racemase
MIYKSTLYEVKGPAAWVTMNRSDSLNSIDGAMLVEVPDAILKVDADDKVHTVILTGAGQAVFSSCIRSIY